MAKDIYEIVKGLNQAASHAVPGALNKKGEVREDLPIGGKNDGFRVSFSGNKMLVKLQSEVTLDEVSEREKFLKEVSDKFDDILKFLKKEYKDITGKSIALKLVTKENPLVQSLSRLRSWVQAQRVYEISGTETEEVPEYGRKIDESLAKFIHENKRKPFSD